MPSAPARYTEQLITMVTPAMKAHIRAVSQAEGASISEVARTYLAAGIELGGGIEAPEDGQDEPTHKKRPLAYHDGPRGSILRDE